MSKVITFPDRTVAPDGKTGITVYYPGYYITGYIADIQGYENELSIRLDAPVMVDLPYRKGRVHLPPVWMNLYHLPAYSFAVPDGTFQEDQKTP